MQLAATRYAAYYGHQMKGLNPEMMKKLKHGAFVRHIPGIYNATWTDMFIGTTYMRLGHGPAGAVGVATDYQQMVKWALSGEVSQNVRAMSNATENTFHTHHKEDANGRIKARQEDHLSLRNTLDVFINPFDNESHPDGALINIMTGQIVHPDMNANNALVIGQLAITDFKEWSARNILWTFKQTICSNGCEKKHVSVSMERVYDQELIYARVIGLLASSRDINFDDELGGGPRVVVSTAAFHARVRGSVPGLGGLKETKMFLPHPRVKVSIAGSLRDREVACSASDRQGSNFESCVWRTVSSQSSHHPQEVLLAQFSLYVHKGGLKPDSFHFDDELACELAAYPLSMFNPDGEIKISKFKSTLQQKLQVTIRTQLLCTEHHNIGALLRVISWPLDELHVYVDAFKKFVFQAL